MQRKLIAVAYTLRTFETSSLWAEFVNGIDASLVLLTAFHKCSFYNYKWSTVIAFMPIL